MAVVEVRNLTKQFDGGHGHGQVRAIDGINLATREGEYLVLLGPSGCGKTTLLRTIAGLEDPTDGEVLIGGNVVNGLPPRLRRIAMVFQSYALYPHKTVLDNIVFPLKAAQLDKAERERKARWAAELLGIDQLLNRRPRQLSGGERNASHWREHWYGNPRSSCSTSRCPTSTPNCEQALVTSSSGFSNASGPRRSM